MPAPRAAAPKRRHDVIHIARGVFGGGLALLPGLAVLGYDRVDLCNAHFDGCAVGHPGRAALVEVGLALIAGAGLWGAFKLGRLFRSASASDTGAWVRRAYLLTVWVAVLATLGVFVVSYVASVGPLRLPGLPNPDVTVSTWVVGLSTAAAAYLPARFWVDAQEGRDVIVATAQSPTTPGLRRFGGTVVPMPQAPGVTVPESGQHVAAWAVEALVSDRMEREPSGRGQGPRSPESVVLTRWWELLWATPTPVAVSTPGGIVFVDPTCVDVEGDELWRGSTLVHQGLYPDHKRDMADRGTYDYRVTAIPFGASVKVSGRVKLRGGVPWVVAAKMPGKPEGTPPTWVRRDGLRNLLQTVSCSGQPRTF